MQIKYNKIGYSNQTNTKQGVIAVYQNSYKQMWKSFLIIFGIYTYMYMYIIMINLSKNLKNLCLKLKQIEQSTDKNNDYGNDDDDNADNR